MGEPNLLSVALLAVTVNMDIFIISIYSYVIFGSFLFCCWGVIARHPVRWLNYGHVPLTMGVMCCCLFTLSIIQEFTKKSTPFFYFNCIFFGYIWYPGGCLVVSWWLPYGGISVARSGQWLLKDNYYPLHICAHLFFFAIYCRENFLDFF